MKNLKIIAQGGLALLIVISIAFLIERVTNYRNVIEIFYPGIKALEVNSTISPVIDKELGSIEKCLIEHSKSPKFLHANINGKQTFCNLQLGQCMYHMLVNFSEVMIRYDFNLLLIEPSLLFCLLPSPRKYNLLTRGFNNVKVQGPRNVVTAYISPSEAEILDQVEVRMKLISAGYRILKFPNWAKSDFITNENSETRNISVRFFIVKQDLVIHLITFYPKGEYLWSSYLNSTDIIVEDLQYVNDTAFENITASPMSLSASSPAQIYLPLDSRCFLLDMMSSEFLECKKDLHSLSIIDVKEQKALKELKVILASQMVIFWLWSKSLQGWLEQCNVFHYSPVLNIALAAKSVEGFNFTALFTNSECQHIENHSNLGTIVKIEVNCHGLSINVFLMYDDKNTYWYEHFDEHNTYKLSFPKFTLCSTDVVGTKINVPCETSEIFESEYGQFLRNTTLYLDPVKMKNVILKSNS